MLYVSLAGAALARYRIAAGVTALMMAAWALLLPCPLWLPYAVWAAAGLVILAVWVAAEPSLLRMWGNRSPSTREGARLTAALQRLCATWGLEREPVLLVDDHYAVSATAGLRTIVVTRGALEALDDCQLAGLMAHEVGHLRQADAAGPPLVWSGNAPFLVLWGLTHALGKLAHALAILLGAEWLLPLLVFREGFVRAAGAGFALALAVLTSLWLLAHGAAWSHRGLVAAGLGLPLSWVVVPGLHWLLAWEGRRSERAADRAAAEAGLAGALTQALAIMQSMEGAPPHGPMATLLRTHPPTELRIDELTRTARL